MKAHAVKFASVQARGAVLVNLEIAGTLFVTNFRLVFLVCLMTLWLSSHVFICK